ncbi:MAG: COX15/CtaA family protein, partial [Hyphomicrobiaceae bacterium]|nr:COX15/CtaA family protein [Hyphomicrobiaceae bacterium]
MAVSMTQGQDGSQSADAAVRTWLLIVAVLVFAMIVVGGATRLTDSGLSITEWLP